MTISVVVAQPRACNPHHLVGVADPRCSKGGLVDGLCTHTRLSAKQPDDEIPNEIGICL